MNQDISQQVQLLLSIDAISPNDCIKIMSICSQVLSSNDYVQALKSSLGPIFCDPTFDIVNEIAQIMLALISLSQNCTYASKIKTKQLKYVLFASLYEYLVDNQPDLLRKVDLGSIRLAFSNAFDLIVIPVEKVQIPAKTVCDSCLSCFGWSKLIHI